MLNRREWLGAVGAGVSVNVAVQAAGRPLLGARFEFAADGTVTLLTGKVELGQGSRTLLAQCVAEELRLPMSEVRVVMADTARVPDDGGTFASLTTPLAVPAVRQAAAAAREMLRTMKPGEAALREIPLEVELTPPAKWKVLGTPVPEPERPRHRDRGAQIRGRFEAARDAGRQGGAAGGIPRRTGRVRGRRGECGKATTSASRRPDEESAERAAAGVRAEVEGEGPASRRRSCSRISGRRPLRR